MNPNSLTPETGKPHNDYFSIVKFWKWFFVILFFVAWFVENFRPVMRIGVWILFIIIIPVQISGLFERKFGRHFYGLRLGAFTTVLAVAAFFVGWLIHGLFWKFIGEARPGAFMEQSEYVADVWVNVFPKGTEFESFRVPARVRAREDDRFDMRYHIDWVKFPNTEPIWVEDGDPLIVGERVKVRTENGDNWLVQLSSELVR